MAETSVEALAAKVEELEARLQRREDEIDVRNLQYLYGYLIDKCMYDQVVDLFTDDAEVRFFGGVSTYVVGDETQVWKAILLTAVLFLPAATYFMWRGIKPYREEVERLEALGL